MSKPVDTFAINFDTLEMPGKIIATEVTIRRIITSDPKKVFHINLCEHPFYPHICDYVRSNPPRTKAT